MHLDVGLASDLKANRNAANIPHNAVVSQTKGAMPGKKARERNDPKVQR